MDGDIDEGNTPSIDTDDLDTLNGFEELGIDVSDLNIISMENVDYFRKALFTVNRKLLEGDSVDDINEFLANEYQDMNEDTITQHPILMGSPLDEDDIYDVNADHEIVTSEVNEDINDNVGNVQNITRDIPICDGMEDIEEKPPLFDRNVPIDENSVEMSIGIEKKGVFQKKRKGIIIGVISAVIIILVISSMVFRDELFSGDDHEHELTADFFISDLEPLSGSLITLSSYDGGGKITHKWSIFPDNYLIVRGSTDMENITLYFSIKGIYRIDKIINRGSETKTIFKNLEVFERRIRVDRESYGDRSTYDVSGDITMNDISGLLPYSEAASYSSLFLEFETQSTNPMETEIESTSSKGYGPFGEEYHQLIKISTERLKIHGSFERKDGGASPITGNIDITQENHIDLFYKRPIENSMIQDSTFTVQITSGNSITFNIKEDLRVFPSKQRDYSDLNIEDISQDRYFSPGDSGTVDWGYYTLIWDAIRCDRISDIPCVILDFSLDEYTKRELDIESFKMSMWLSDGYPISMRTLINITSEADGTNDYILNVNQDLLTFEIGELPIIYGLNEHQHSDIRSIEEIYPELSTGFHADWDMVPKLGSFPCSIPSDFDAEDALESFKDDLNYRKYSSNRDQLYSIYTNFSKIKDLTSSYVDQWEISLGQKDDEMSWNETITREHNAGILSRISGPSLSREDLLSILTYSGSEKAVKKVLGSIDQKAATSLFGTSEPGDGNNVDLKTMSLGTESERPYPKLGMINPSLTERIDMCYFISYLDGTFEVGLDMTNGQVSFIRGYSYKRL